MLATFGFIVTGICFIIFAYSFNRLVIRNLKLSLSQFSYAYYSLGFALLNWGIAAAMGGSNILRSSVVVGDGFILLGSLFLIHLRLPSKRRILIWPVSAIALIMLVLRAVYFTPVPFMRDGILIFNTQMIVAVVLGLVFGLIWLPINLYVAKLITNEIKQETINTIYSGIYIAVTVAAVIFLAARRTITVILSFIAIGICFIMLIWSNILVAKMMDKPNGK